MEINKASTRETGEINIRVNKVFAEFLFLLICFIGISRYNIYNDVYQNGYVFESYTIIINL